MAKIAKPEIYHVASTVVRQGPLQQYLESVGAGEWVSTDAPSPAELLIEVAGRSCYRSFKPGLNPNVTKVREGNAIYLANILKQRHGSVLEHGYDTFILHKVSRVLTHELVRHRLSNFSQESLRFVRLDKIDAYWPRVFEHHPKRDQLFAVFYEAVELLEQKQIQLAEILEIDDEETFHSKKELTSAMRRLAPLGLATTIMITTNHRNWRHLVQQRTHRAAEEEIRLAFSRIWEILRETYPNIYQDGVAEMIDGAWEVRFAYEKV